MIASTPTPENIVPGGDNNAEVRAGYNYEDLLLRAGLLTGETAVGAAISESSPDKLIVTEDIEASWLLPSASYRDSFGSLLSQDLRESAELGDLYYGRPLERNNGKLVRSAAAAIRNRALELTETGEMEEGSNIEVCIFGDPLGLSTRRLMDNIPESMRSRMRVTIADTSSKRLIDVIESGVLEQYPGQIEFKTVENPADLSFDKDRRPLAIIADNLLGSRPADRMVKTENGSVAQYREALDPVLTEPLVTINPVTGMSSSIPQVNFKRRGLLGDTASRLGYYRRIAGDLRFKALNILHSNLSDTGIHIRRRERAVNDLLSGRARPEGLDPTVSGLQYNYCPEIEDITSNLVIQVKIGGMVFLADRFRLGNDTKYVDQLTLRNGDVVDNLVEVHHLFAGAEQAKTVIGDSGNVYTRYLNSDGLARVFVIDRSESAEQCDRTSGGFFESLKIPDRRAAILQRIKEELAVAAQDEIIPGMPFADAGDRVDLIFQAYTSQFTDARLDYQMQVDIAQSAYDAGHDRLALKYTEMASAVAPGADVAASLLRAKILNRNGQTETAGTILKHTSEIAPHNPEVWSEYAKNANDIGDLETYIKALGEYINTDPDLALYDPSRPNDITRLTTLMCRAQLLLSERYRLSDKPFKTLLVEDMKLENGMWVDNASIQSLTRAHVERIKAADMADRAFDTLQSALNHAGILGEDIDNALQQLADIRDRAWYTFNIRGSEKTLLPRNLWPDRVWSDSPLSRLSYLGGSVYVSDEGLEDMAVYGSGSLLGSDATDKDLSLAGFDRQRYEYFRAPETKKRPFVYLGGSLEASVRSKFEISTRVLNRNTVVFGQPGQGKTETILQLLEDLPSTGCNSIVIDPTGEYRLSLPNRIYANGGGTTTVIRPGDPESIPFSIDLFDVPPGYTPQSWAGELYNIFATAFDMEEPMPQLLTEVLSRVYEECGWALELTSENQPLPPEKRQVPTFDTLLEVGLRAISEKKYDKVAEDRVSGWYTMRIGSLSAGESGTILETGNSLDIDELLKRNVIFSLEGIKSTDEMTFIKIALLKKLRAHNESAARKVGVSQGFRTMIVLEEAQNELQNSKGADTPRSRAVNAFCDAIQQDRKWGLGYLISGQNASDVANRVIKNSALKIHHKSGGDDVKVMADAMNMDLSMAENINLKLVPGTALVYASDDFEQLPQLLQMKELPDELPEVPEYPAPPVRRFAAANYSEHGLFTVSEITKAKYQARMAFDERTSVADIPKISQISWGRLFVYAIGQAFATDSILPAVPEQFQSYWNDMDPRERGCLLREMIRSDLKARGVSFSDASYETNRFASQMAVTATRILNNGVGAGNKAGPGYVNWRRALLSERRRHSERIEGDTPREDNFSLPPQRFVPGLPQFSPDTRVERRVADISKHPFDISRGDVNVRLIRHSMFGSLKDRLIRDIRFVNDGSEDLHSSLQVIAEAMKLTETIGLPSEFESNLHDPISELVLAA